MSSTLAPEHHAEAYRAELIGYCYRFFGSYAEAEDAVQETLVRAWQADSGFEQRASLRTWLYKIATNVCLDMKRATQRRSLPMDLSAPGHVPEDASALATRGEATWIGPIADSALVADPADAAVRRESIRLAFITALQILPPRQRVVLILRDVLALSAQEVADVLDTTVASANSALARARATVAEHDPRSVPVAPVEAEDRALLLNYVRAFEAYDVDALLRLLTADATFSMPPFELWLRGADAIGQWWRGPGEVCRNSRTLVVAANRQPAVAVYHAVGAGRWEPFALHVLETAGGRIDSITHFMGPAVFAEFGLPAEIVESAV